MRTQKRKTKKSFFKRLEKLKPAKSRRKSKGYKKSVKKDRRTHFVGLAIKLSGILVFTCVLSLLVYYIYLTQKYKKFETNPDIGDVKVVQNPTEETSYYVLLNINRTLDPDHSFTELSYFLRLDYKDESMTILSIPTEFYAWDYSARSYEKVKNFRNLGAQKEPRQDTSYSLNGINEMLGMKIDYYLDLDIETLSKLLNKIGGTTFVVDKQNYQIGDYKDLLDAIKDKEPDELGGTSAGFLKAFFTQLGKQQGLIREEWVYRIGTGFYTNLNNPEMFRFVNLLSSQKLSISTNYLDETVLREEDSVNPSIEVFDQSRIDFVIKKEFENIDIKKEQARFEIYNGTSERLLATYWGRFFKNSSLDVIRVGTVKEVENTEIYIPGNNSSYSESIKEIKRLLGVDPIIVNERPSSVITTGDVIVVLGSDVLE